MDPSDILRRTQTRTIWNDYRAQKLQTQTTTFVAAAMGSGTTLDVTSVISGTLSVGFEFVVSETTHTVTAFVTGNGLIGTYTITPSLTLTSATTLTGSSCPPANCVALNTGCGVINYPSYEQRQAVAEGRMNCKTCSNNTGPPCQ
jgi:hypothetical protein